MTKTDHQKQIKKLKDENVKLHNSTYLLKNMKKLDNDGHYIVFCPPEMFDAWTGVIPDLPRHTVICSNDYKLEDLIEFLGKQGYEVTKTPNIKEKQNDQS